MILNRPSTRLAQPQGPVEIDYDNPLAKGLVSYINPALKDTLRLGQPSFTTVQDGIALSGNGSSLLYKNIPAFTNAATILFVGNWLTGGQHIVSIGTQGTGDQCFILQAGTTGSSRPRALIRVAQGGGITTAEAFGSGNDTEYPEIETWVARYDGTTALKLFRNGEDYTGSNLNTSASGSMSQMNNTGLGGTNRGSDAFAKVGQLGVLALFWNRALSLSEIQNISLNPWKIFKPIQRKNYFYTEASVSPGDITLTANSVLLSNISSSDSVVQNSLLNADISIQSVITSNASIIQSNVLTGSSVIENILSNNSGIQQQNLLLGNSSLSPSTSTSANLEQVNLLLGSDVALRTISTTAGILQSHLLLGGENLQPNYASSGSIALVPITELLANSVSQVDLSDSGSIQQEHKLLSNAPNQSVLSSNAEVVQLHVLVGNNSTQIVLSDSGAIATSGSLTADNAQQTNTSSSGSVIAAAFLQGNVVKQLNLSSSGAITQGGELPPLTDAEIRQMFAMLQVAVAKLQTRIDAVL